MHPLPRYIPGTSYSLEGHQDSYKAGDWVDVYFTGPDYAGTGRIITCNRYDGYNSDTASVDFMYVTPRLKEWTSTPNAIMWGVTGNMLPSLIAFQLCL